MLADDQRYASLKAWRSGQVWLYDRRVTAAGANEYWSRGVTQPDRILADLIKIFYPDLARDYEFEWYRQVPAD
jgi:iron complex transport system substrate-binding protein